MSNKRRVVGLGEALWDVLPDGKKLGGAPANFAFHVGQFLGQDSVLAVSALGDDELADETVAALDGHGLSHLMPRVPYPTGTVQVTLDGQGVPTYDIKENVAWDNIPWNGDILAEAETCRAVCFGTLAQRNAVSRATILKFLAHTPDDCLKIFDINLRQHFYSKDIVEQSLKSCDILKINDEELATIGRLFGLAGMDAEDQCRHLLEEYGLDMVVLTCGIDGSCVFSSDHKSCMCTPRVTVADTVGAGDSFTGAFCAAILSGTKQTANLVTSHKDLTFQSYMNAESL